MLSSSRLTDDLSGRVIGPDDPDYDEARALFYGGFDRRPAAIVRVAGAPDVARAIEIARESGLELGVRSGGHSPPVTAFPTAASWSISRTCVTSSSTSRAARRGRRPG